jgi:REP element-mobilizing transposase RayT
MNRHWLITWTTYGSWLPGDHRGFVSPVLDESGNEVIHNIPKTPYDKDAPRLNNYARSQLKCPPVSLVREQATVITDQFDETATYRKWKLYVMAVMPTHVHLVVGVPDDPDPETLLRDFKAYASRALNRKWDRPKSETWWTESGSKRKLPHEGALIAVCRYVRDQDHALVVRVDAMALRGERQGR